MTETNGVNGEQMRSAMSKLDLALNQLERTVNSEIMTRAKLLEQMMDPRRDVYRECGYPPEGEVLTVDRFRTLWEREAIAAKALKVWPDACWKVNPWVYEDPDSTKVTPFEAAWDVVGQNLRGGNSRYRQEQGSPVWQVLHQADILAGLGHYGILFYGFDDGADLAEPVKGVKIEGSLESPEKDVTPEEYEQQMESFYASPGGRRYRITSNARGTALTHLCPYSEYQAQILRYETNKYSPRFGLPTLYQITMHNPAYPAAGQGYNWNTYTVHWTRVQHICEGIDSKVFHVPLMRPIYNNLLGISKLYCGSPEMYWRGAFAGWSLETHPSMGGEVDVPTEAIRAMMNDFGNKLRRYLLLVGMHANSLAPQVVDPTPQIKVQLEAVAIYLDVPMRILMGSERGELSSAQDTNEMDDRAMRRNDRYTTPSLVVPLVDRLILTGVLPDPKSGFAVEWPPMATVGEKEKASVAESYTRALVAYGTGGLEAMIPPLNYLVEFLGWDEEKATMVLEQAGKDLEGDGEDNVTGGSRLAGFAGGVTAMLEMFKMRKDGTISDATLEEMIKLFFKTGKSKAVELADELPEPPEGEGLTDGVPGSPPGQPPSSSEGEEEETESETIAAVEIPAFGDAASGSKGGA